MLSHAQRLCDISRQATSRSWAATAHVHLMTWHSRPTAWHFLFSLAFSNASAVWRDRPAPPLPAQKQTRMGERASPKHGPFVRQPEDPAAGQSELAWVCPYSLVPSNFLVRQGDHHGLNYFTRRGRALGPAFRVQTAAASRATWIARKL